MNIRENPDDSIRAATHNWHQYWSTLEVDKNSWTESILLLQLKRFFRRSGGVELAYNITSSEIGKRKGQLTLEPGCGTGEVSLRLTQLGHRVILLDTSPAALRLAQRAALTAGIQAPLLQASIFHLPFRSGVFDFEFNIGVLDHFKVEDRPRALAEMVRVAQPGGRLVVIANDARSLIHSRAMRYAQKKGIWRFGFKDAIRSWQTEWRTPDGGIIREYSRGFLSQFEFLRYYLPQSPRWQKWFFRLFFLGSLPLSLLNHFPGQYRVAVIEKRESHE